MTPVDSGDPLCHFDTAMSGRAPSSPPPSSPTAHSILQRVQNGEELPTISADTELSLEMLAAIISSPLALALMKQPYRGYQETK